MIISKKLSIIVVPLILSVGIAYLLVDVQDSELSQYNNNSQQISPDLDLVNTEAKINFSDIGIDIDLSSTVVVLPEFTAFAYEENGFYDYYRNECSEKCLTVQLSENVGMNNINNKNAFYLFHYIIGFDYVTDLEIHNNPSVLNSFDKVILLHNEYVTKKEFDAITNHPNVVYLYPNALYAEVTFDEQENSISLVRGHGYPTPEITNGFGWKFDNTHPYEYDVECENWEFYSIDNGYMLNCYPEKRLSYDVELVKTILEL